MTVPIKIGGTDDTTVCTHNRYRRYIWYKCNAPVVAVGVYATETFGKPGTPCATGKVVPPRAGKSLRGSDTNGGADSICAAAGRRMLAPIALRAIGPVEPAKISYAVHSPAALGRQQPGRSDE